MELKKYIKTIFKPAVAKRAKAMKNAKKARSRAKTESAESALAALEKRLGYKFKDRKILLEALTHPGAVGVSKGKMRSNQRLEFLGDAVLQSIITDTVFRKFDSLEEGKLTKIRIALTQGSFLAELSRDLQIPQCLILPQGSEEIRSQASAAEDVFEAIVGAIYLDANFEKARKAVLAWYKRKLDELPELVSHQNPKGALQELAAKLGETVEYVLLSQSGPDHKKVFEIEVRVASKPYARASAGSKKAAEVKAALQACAEYSKIVEGRLPKTPSEGESNSSKRTKKAKQTRLPSVPQSGQKRPS